MRTTLTIDDDVVTKLQRLSKTTGKSFKEVVNETLRLGLVTERNLHKNKPPSFKVEAQPLGLKPGYSIDNIAELLEQAEGANFK